MKYIKYTCIAALIFISTSLYAAEYRTIHDVGIDPESTSIGNVIGFNTTSLGAIESPVPITNEEHVSLYYAQMMNSDIDLYAMGIHRNLNHKWTTNLAAVYEATDGGFRTVSQNGTVSATESLNYLSTELIANITYALRPNLHVGFSTHYIAREQFGVHGNAWGYSFGARYDERTYGMAFGSRYANSPSVNFSNGGEESLSANYYLAGRIDIPFWLPTQLFAQETYTPRYKTSQHNGGFRVMLDDLFSASIGYMQTRGYRENVEGHLTAGLSMYLPAFTVHYSYNGSDYIEQNAQHRISVSIKY